MAFHIQFKAYEKYCGGALEHWFLVSPHHEDWVPKSNASSKLLHLRDNIVSLGNKLQGENIKNHSPRPI